MQRKSGASEKPLFTDAVTIGLDPEFQYLTAKKMPIKGSYLSRRSRIRGPLI